MLTTMGKQGGRRAAALALMVGVLMSLAGCAKASVALTIHQDDTVTEVARVAVSTALLTSAGTDIDTVVDQALPKDWPVASRERYVDGDYTGVQLTSKPVPLSLVAIGTAHVQHTNHLYVMDGVLDTTNASASGQTASFTLSITFPGDVQQTNGQRSGRTVTWTGQTGSVIPVRAVADDGFYFQLGQSVAHYTVDGAAGVVLLAILVIVIRDRRRGPVVRPLYPVPAPAFVASTPPWSGPASWTPGPDVVPHPQQPPRVERRHEGW